jgi:KUP system potassium uptake protein
VKECLLTLGGPEAQVEGLFGVLSLMFWALVMVVTVKYVCFIMRADNHGEGGIFALWPSFRNAFANVPGRREG